MPTKIPLACENGHECTLTLEEVNIEKLEVTGVINTPQKCPVCGSDLTGKGGKYVKDEDDLLVRVGDYENETRH